MYVEEWLAQKTPLFPSAPVRRHTNVHVAFLRASSSRQRRARSPLQQEDLAGEDSLSRSYSAREQLAEDKRGGMREFAQNYSSRHFFLFFWGSPREARRFPPNRYEYLVPKFMFLENKGYFKADSNLTCQAPSEYVSAHNCDWSNQPARPHRDRKSLLPVCDK